MKKEMLINVLQPEESRIAIVEDGILEELYVERNSLENYVGNIYKGRVVNIEPSIQAAFIDFGVGRNGFLHVSDVEFQYYKHLVNGERDVEEDDEISLEDIEEDDDDDPLWDEDDEDDEEASFPENGTNNQSLDGTEDQPNKRQKVT